MNKEKIVDFLFKLSKLYIDLNENIRAGTFNRAAVTIRDSALSEITKGSQTTHLHGIGDSTSREIDEFIKTGTSKRYIKLEESMVDVDSTSSKLKGAIDKLNRLKKDKSHSTIQ